MFTEVPHCAIKNYQNCYILFSRISYDSSAGIKERELT